jgi:CDGSH-type Zn-finger protein
MSNKEEKQKTSISLDKVSPYRVTNLENFTNSREEKLETTTEMYLCRCGHSRTRPYCDGSHAVMGIDSEKKPGRAKDKIRDFKGKDIIIHDNRGVCSHDQSCLKEQPDVFESGGVPWIKPDAANAEDIKKTIEKCPSGALSYTHEGKTWTGSGREPAIKVSHNGPLHVTGNITLEDDMNSKPCLEEHYTLCRCGGSKNKPFCDGTHLENGFNDEDN